MVEKLFCILGGLLSIFGAIVSSHREDLFTSSYYAVEQNDIVFTSARSQNGTKLHFTKHQIQMDSIQLKKVHSQEVLSYEVSNPTSKDVSFDVIINGEEYFDDEFFDITCSSITVPARGKAQGTITITLKKSVVEDYSLPFTITYQIA